MKRFDAIAFDLDGTLIDSAGGIAHALNAALAEAACCLSICTPCARG